ncbi:metal ABC transporter permease [candidate division KSB1 bacterium]|nr:metal ABC transporter permease [candidate division KSB1 bacterium]
MDTLLFLSAPFTACLLLVGILGYFGNHILSRGVIFVDIAVAQVAALGTMIGILLGFAEGSFYSSLFSLGFTLVVVSLFAVSKFQHREISQEVIIGIIYCLALAAAMLLVDMVPGGSNYIQKTLTGAILWVTWTDNLLTFVIFASVATIHLFVIKRFIKISMGEKGGLTRSQLLWSELIFYVTFGIVIVNAVKIGGIFLVFMYLIGPAATALFISEKWSLRFIFSWLIGFVGSVIGVLISYHYDFSNGPTIVCVLGLFLILIGLLSKNNKKETLKSMIRS